MRYWIVVLALLYSACTLGATLDERLASLKAVTLEASHDEPARVSGFTNLHTARVTYYEVAGEVVTSNTVQVFIKNYLSVDPENPEAAYWLNSVPAPLRPAPVEEKYLAGRTLSSWTNLSQAEQLVLIRNFCNATWKGIEGQSGVADIIDFQVSNVNSTTVLVSGSFDTGTNWETRAYYVRVKNINQDNLTANGNIHFQRKID